MMIIFFFFEMQAAMSSKEWYETQECVWFLEYSLVVVFHLPLISFLIIFSSG